MTCDQYDVHLKGDQNDAATRHYYQQNTKPCPKCQQAIQKDSGCDHMTCRCVCRSVLCDTIAKLVAHIPPPPPPTYPRTIVCVEHARTEFDCT